MKISILGAGSFGRALSQLLLDKGHTVSVWGRSLGTDMEGCLKGADLALFAVPAQSFREVFLAACRFMPEDIPVVNVAKGIELGSLLRMSQVAEDIRPGVRYVALSGPSHAEEIELKLPTTVVVCSEDPGLARMAQDVFITDWFRVYTQDDLTGTELGGSLKNIIALGAGISDGMGFGDNTKAALMTRGMAEITRLALAMGARQETFLGLTGIGDLIVTCTSRHSRNWRCGYLMGQGMPSAEAQAEIGMVVEGASTAFAAEQLAEKYGVDMPITNTICAVLRGEKKASEGIAELMTRDRKAE
ncbi:MAG: NAD(P)-dependent glycerol-3-phosphate dehydrogenase [Clostridia bacterium]|nr:NAD(P)-dependent glycerol-3-phosphate dehydrogenase [Clostridia bacterium]